MALNECRALIGRLGKCGFPFQCAHGRPSLIPIVVLDGNVAGNEEGREKKRVKFEQIPRN